MADVGDAPMPALEPLAALPRNPLLLQVNARAVLARTGGDLSTLGNEAWLSRLQRDGIDILYVLGVWTTGEAGAKHSADKLAAAGCSEEQLQWAASSPFAITSYTVSEELGGEAALAKLRVALRSIGVRLILDFVGNHMAVDHEWCSTHPSWLVRGSEEALAAAPQNFFRTAEGAIVAHGRDPYFDGWQDTVQLNYGCAELREEMVRQLLALAARCDGLRCDMAMLLCSDVFARTWRSSLEAVGESDCAAVLADEWWPAAIATVRKEHAGFLFMAEVYWDMEGRLQRDGFDYTYDKRLYDRLHGSDGKGVRGHLHADMRFQRASVRFIENHDEERAASAFGVGRRAATAAALTFTLPGLRFLHDGQQYGFTRQISMHVSRLPGKPDAIAGWLYAFYTRLFRLLKRAELRDGDWQLLATSASRHGEARDASLVAHVSYLPGSVLLVVANVCDDEAHGHLLLPEAVLDALPRVSDGGDCERLFATDLLGDAFAELPVRQAVDEGLWVKLGGWGLHAFELSVAEPHDAR